MHIFTMSVIFVQSFEKIQRKLLREVDFTKYAVIIQTSYLVFKELQRGIILNLLSLFSYHMCIVRWSRCGENLKKSDKSYSEVIEQTLNYRRNDRITE